VTTNETDPTDDRTPEDDLSEGDESAADEIDLDEAGSTAEPEPSPAEEPEMLRTRAAGDDTAVDEPLLTDATGYQDRWYEIQTGFVDEPGRAVQSAAELLTEVMDDLTRRLATELEAFDAQCGAGDDASTEDLRVAFQRYRSFFDRLLAA
jgi:hypothetical protein